MSSASVVLGCLAGEGRKMVDLSENKPAGGRWPPNLVFTHLPGCRRVGERQVKSLSGIRPDDVGTSYGEHKSRSMSGSKPAMLTTTYADPDDTETVTAWNCEPGCPVAELDRQSGVTTSSGPGTKCNRRDANGKCQGHENPTFRPTFHADERSVLSPDTGGASRMFPQFEYDHDDPFIAGFQYVAKPSTAEREAGLTEENMLCACGTPPSVEVESTTTPVCPTCRKWLRKPKGHEAVHREEGTAGLDSPRAGAGRTAKTRWCVHPTVKPIGIMRWLVRLVTPTNGTVLDPFCGSGTTGAAAMLEGCDFIGCEREPEYAAIARARIAHWKEEAERRDATPDKPPKAPRKPRAPKVATEPPAPVVAAPPPPVERAPEAPRPTATPATPKRRRPAVDAPDALLLPFASPPRSTP
ncbi:MAG: hypothetical protein KGS10_04315 [Chloroflexi bacterium]|nr:hypothetical protein [Chloroflexota bacterium]